MLKQIPPDKKKHLIVGALLAFACAWLGYFLWPQHILIAIGFGWMVSIAAGFGFELFSYVTGIGHAEWMDAIVTVIGGLGGGIFALAAVSALM